jgi:uncharacterized membrane protein (GlpM family)
MNIQEFFISFILGGIIVSVVLLLTDLFNPLIGSLFWAFPITIIPILYSLHYQNKSNTFISKFLTSSSFSLIILFLTTFSMSYFIKYNNIKNTLFKSVFVWMFLSILFYQLIIYLGFSKYFI